MKLSTKLTLFITGSKLAIVLLFIILLPFLVREIASGFTNYTLEQQRKQVIKNIDKNGIDFYLQDDESYGSYTMLKEEFIALLPVGGQVKIDTIKDEQRIIEADTLSYRILSQTVNRNGKNYLLEVGKTIASIDQYNSQLQGYAALVFVLLILLSILLDLTFVRILIKPLAKIIKSRLTHKKFPFVADVPLIRTSTQDFQFLDQSILQLMSQINEAFYKEREFTSNASHEIMTPISILQHKMENMIADDDLPENIAMAVLEMMKTLNRLKKVANSLLLIARIDNEQYIRKQDVKPLHLLEQISEEISHRLDEKNIQLRINVNDHLLLKEVNQDLLYQLFFNLVHNAIKFNRDRGDIYIQDRFLASGAYQISVADQGVGIAPNQLTHIFQRFVKSNAEENPGYGLGLAIVKSIVDYHSLQIEVSSELGQGTTFNIIFQHWSKID